MAAGRRLEAHPAPGVGPRSAPADAAVIILAGGKSQRMGGRPKGALTWGDGTILEHLASQGLVAARQVVVVGGEEMRAPADVTRTADIFADCGPLGGLHAGLIAARFDDCVVVACDMPFVTSAVMRLLLGLLAGYEAAVPQTEDGIHPLLAGYSRRCLPAVEEQLRAGDRRMRSFFARVSTRWVTEDQLRPADPDLQCMFNINTWQDYERALQLAGGTAAQT